MAFSQMLAIRSWSKELWASVVRGSNEEHYEISLAFAAAI